MEYNLITNIEACYVAVPQILYYSHFPAMAVSLILGAFVYFKNRNSLSAKILFFISIFFSLWALFDILAWTTWTSYDSRIIMVLWSLMNVLEPLIFAAFLYFTFVFVNK